MAINNESDNTLKQRAIRTGRYLRDEFGTTPHRLNVRMSRRLWITSIGAPLIAAFVLGRCSAPKPDTVAMSGDAPLPTRAPGKPTEVAAVKPTETLPAAPKPAEKPAAKPAAAPSSPKPVESPVTRAAQKVVETPGIKEKFAEATKIVSTTLPADVIAAIRAGGASAYDGVGQAVDADF